MTSKIQEIEARFGKPIAEIFKDFYGRGWSQRDIAKELGVSQATVSQWAGKAGLQITLVRTLVPAGGDQDVLS